MRFAIALLLLIPACTQFPELEGTVPPSQSQAAFPQLVPLAPLVAQANQSASATPPSSAGLPARIANLNARAARLRGPVIPAPVRARMLRTIR